MKKNLKGCIELTESSASKVLLDMNSYELIERAGAKPDLVHKKNAHMTASWRFSDATRIAFPAGGLDLTAYRYLTFSVFSVGGEGGSFCLMFDNSPKGEGKGGYACMLPIVRNGWNDYRVELPFLRAVGEAEGWNRVQSICFDCVMGGQANHASTVLYIDNLFGYTTYAAPLYTTMPELKGAAVLSRSGNFSIVDRKRIANTPDGVDAKPFEADGVLWLPMAPIAAGFAHSAVVDTVAATLSFSYRRKKYAFSGNSKYMTVDGTEEPLGFYPVVQNGALFFPSEFVRSFFHRRQCYVDPMGLIVISNRRAIFESAKDEVIIRRLIADTTYLRPDAERVLADLHRRFPNSSRGRLLASFEDLMQLRRDAKADETLKGYVAALKAQYGNKTEYFNATPATDNLNGCADAVIAYSMLYRVTGDKIYSERAALECEALAALTDWNPESMETLGNLALAVSIAYDWCHHVWSEARKAIVERAMLRFAMRPCLEAYDGKGRMWREGSAVASVANAGMLAAALTLADVYPQTAYKLLDRILRNVEPCFTAYMPDGGAVESVTAWQKSTRALALTVAMLEKACGTDYGFASTPGFKATAYFPIYAEGNGGAWNYHNAEALDVDTSILPWFAMHMDNPVVAWMRRQQILSGKKAVHAFDILFYKPIDESMTPSMPLDAVYRRAGLAVLRSGWGADANMIGLHGGKNNEVGGDLDAGSFILEMGGERFIVETGGEDALPILLRRRAEGQNTVTVDPASMPAPDQNPDARAIFTEVRGAAQKAYAVVDMVTISDTILRAKRGILLTADRTVAVIQDEMTLTHAADVAWTAWTKAAVKLNASGRVAKLTQNGKTLECRLCGVGSPARFTATEHEGGLTRLTVALSGKEKLRMAVVCKLADTEAGYEVVPMSKWGEI